VPVETHRSFCRFCHAICGIEVDVEDGRILDVRGDRAVLAVKASASSRPFYR
jgi:anaerobic selenocysteine-containing dehydrogenase